MELLQLGGLFRSPQKIPQQFSMVAKLQVTKKRVMTRSSTTTVLNKNYIRIIKMSYKFHGLKFLTQNLLDLKILKVQS